MTTKELLKEVLKDSVFQDKYGIPADKLRDISFDTTSPYPIVEAIKMIIKLKDNRTPDSAVFKSIKQNIFQISE